MATLIEIATRIQDLYEQNYTPNDRFLDIDDFKFQVATTYSSIINKQYQIIRQQNRQVDGFSNVEIPAQWLLPQNIKLQKDTTRQGRHFAILEHPVFSFDWDNYANSLQGIHSLGTKHCVYRKIGLHERKFINILPVIGDILFYLDSPERIVFVGGKDGDEAVIQYVPKVVGDENDCLLSDNIIPELMDAILDRMFKSKNGNFIQKIDDQNPNIVPEQQNNPAVK